MNNNHHSAVVAGLSLGREGPSIKSGKYGNRFKNQNNVNYNLSNIPSQPPLHQTVSAGQYTFWL